MGRKKERRNSTNSKRISTTEIASSSKNVEETQDGNEGVDSSLNSSSLVVEEDLGISSDVAVLTKSMEEEGRSGGLKEEIATQEIQQPDLKIVTSLYTVTNLSAALTDEPPS